MISHLTELGDVEEDLDKMYATVTGLMGAVSRIRDNPENYIGNKELLKKETNEIKEELHKLREEMSDIKQHLTADNALVWQRFQQRGGYA